MTTMQQIDAANGWNVRVTENFRAVSPAGLYGIRQAGTTGLTLGYWGGEFNGVSVSDGTVVLTNSATNYVVAHRTTGVVTAATNTTNWNNTSTYMRLYELAASGGTFAIAATSDKRQAFGDAGGGGGGSNAWGDLTGVPAPIEDIAALTDPGADRILFWDDSAGEYTHLTVGTGLSITGTSLAATGGGGGGGTVDTIVAGSGITVDATDPANPIVSASGGGGGGATSDIPDPAFSYWGPSKVAVHSVGGQIVGDPFIVWDGSAWVMYDFVTGSSPTIKTQYKTAATLETLSGATATDLAGLTNYHKFVLLVDQEGVPVVVGGNYHGYAVKYLTTIADKEIYHFTCSTLTGTWTLGSKVIAKGGSGDKDEYNTDTPYAIWDGSKVRLWYMGAPASSLATYGFAIRMLKAEATDPDGPFTKSSTDVLLPATTGVWDYGWMGGVQIRLRPNGKYIMLFNAGDNRPSSAGIEPDASAVGFAYSDSLDGPWTKDAANPYLSAANAPTDGLELTNIWRGHMVFDPAVRGWYLFYNTGATGVERVTFARQNVYDYFYDNGLNDGYNIQTLTTTKTDVLNSRVNLPPGRYRFRAAINLFADGTGASPKLDVDTFLQINGTDFRTGRDFIGSYAYENRDIEINHLLTLGARGYVILAIQVTGGTPPATAKARRLRINVERIT